MSEKYYSSGRATRATVSGRLVISPPCRANNTTMVNSWPTRDTCAQERLRDDIDVRVRGLLTELTGG